MFREMLDLRAHVQPRTLRRQHSTKETTNMIFKAHTNLALAEGGDREGLISFLEGYTGCGADVDATCVLTGAGTDVGGDDDDNACGSAAFRMHFSIAILAGGRASLMAVEKGTRRRKSAVGNMNGTFQVIDKVCCHARKTRGACRHGEQEKGNELHDDFLHTTTQPKHYVA